MKSGVELIKEERERQISKEGYDAKHDAQHTHYELAMAAACYCAPAKIFVMDTYHVNRVQFIDPWPFSDGDKRYSYGERRDNPGNGLPSPHRYNTQERLDLLVKAGAMIAAQIDLILAKKK